MKMNRLKTIYMAIIAAVFLLVLISLNVFIRDGEKIFKREGCIGCHSFKGKGGETGPDLTGVSAGRSAKWIMDQIRNPRSHNPDARMPGFNHLSIIEVYAIARYLNS